MNENVQDAGVCIDSDLFKRDLGNLELTDSELAILKEGGVDPKTLEEDSGLNLGALDDDILGDILPIRCEESNYLDLDACLNPADGPATNDSEVGNDTDTGNKKPSPFLTNENERKRLQALLDDATKINETFLDKQLEAVRRRNRRISERRGGIETVVKKLMIEVDNAHKLSQPVIVITTEEDKPKNDRSEAVIEITQH